MQQPSDLFGGIQETPTASEEEAEVKLGSLPDRVLGFFKDHKYQTYNCLELFGHFKDKTPTIIRNTVRKLWREKKLDCVGETRGPGPIGLDHVTLTLNLHRSEKW